MNIGDLDERVTLYSAVAGKDSSGFPGITYTLIGTFWAHIRSQKGDESFTAARSEGGRVIKVMMRWRDDIRATWRLDWSPDPQITPEQYDIVDVDRTKRRDGELWLMCKARKVT